MDERDLKQLLFEYNAYEVLYKFDDKNIFYHVIILAIDQHEAIKKVRKNNMECEIFSIKQVSYEI